MQEIKMVKLNTIKKNPRLFTCMTCSTIFFSKKACKSRIPKYCSSLCYGKSLEIKIYCKLCNIEIHNNNQRKHVRKYCSIICRGKARKGIPLSTTWKAALSVGRKSSEKCKGENLYNWKGGQAKRDDTRTTREYRYWRKSVFIRDGYTCQHCNKKNLYLHAHHIKQKAQYPDLIHDINNGITLCIPCHNKVHGFNTSSIHKF